MAAPQIYLVTGGARGLGEGLVSTLLQRPNTTVIAGVRDPNSRTAEQLKDLARADGSRLIIVKIDSASDTDPKDAVAELQTKYEVARIDVVIANAAIGAPPAPVASASIEDFRTNYQINAFAPVLLFQATWPLLQKSANPKFIGITTCLATISRMEDWQWPAVVYGSSKAAMNYIVRKMHFENEQLVAFVVHPGWVQTDSGNGFAKAQGLEKAPMTIEYSVDFILGKIDAATKDNISGTFQYIDKGSDYAW